MRAEGEVVFIPTEGVEAWARFDEFVEYEHERLYKALYFVTGSREDAEDISQDAFLKLWERWEDIDRIPDPTGYLFRVALNGFRMRRRRAAMALRRVAPARTERDAFADAEMRTDVRRLLLGLTPRQRAALLLVDLLGYPSEQAARILRVRPSTVRNLVRSARDEGLFERRKERGMPEVQEVFRMATQKVRPDDGFVERQQANQRRRARNQKLGALALVAALGIGAVTAWVITTGERADPTGTPVGNDPSGTGSTGSPDVDVVETTETSWYVQGPEGFVPAPEGAVASFPPERGLIAQLYVGSPEANPAPDFVYVYDDGRVITHGWDEDLRWVGERRLTAEGVDLVLSGDIQADDLTPVSNGIPAELWENPELKPFVPSAYGVCFWDENGSPPAFEGQFLGPPMPPDSLLKGFPAKVRRILSGDIASDGCSTVTPDQARTIAEILDDVRIEDSEGRSFIANLHMFLPHGWRVSGCVPGGCG
jgi:RNA polymerase sigma-70 factor (ECF subfamily)